MLLVAFLLAVVAPHLPAVSTAASRTAATTVISAVIEGTTTGSTVPTGPALTVIAPRGATVASLAATYHRDASAIQWANGLTAGSSPQAGSELLLPPGPGALVQVGPGELPSRLAQSLGISTATLLAYNRLQTDTPPPAGTYLQVPLASAPAGALNAAAFVPEAPGVPEVPSSQGPDHFPYGQCTYWVALHRDVSWGGNAGQWWAHAGGVAPEGHVPVAGAIAVFDYWPLGHVALVERVNPDGSFVISEMNYEGWARVDQRTISSTDRSLVGFIY